MMSLKVICLLCSVFFQSAYSDDKPKTVEIFCSMPDIPCGMASRSPFFGYAVSTKCVAVNEGFLSDAEETVEFQANENGEVDARCPEYHVVKKLAMTFSDKSHVASIKALCVALSDPSQAEVTHEASSESMANSMADCGDDSAMQYMTLSAADGVTTQVVLGCIKFKSQ